MSNEMADWMIEKANAKESEHLKMRVGLHKILALSLNYNGAYTKAYKLTDHVNNLHECIDLITDVAEESLQKDM